LKCPFSFFSTPLTISTQRPLVAAWASGALTGLLGGLESTVNKEYENNAATRDEFVVKGEYDLLLFLLLR
jgi:hypothetical protein